MSSASGVPAPATAPNQPSASIPLIDFSHLQSADPDVVDAASKALFAAMRDVGFVYLKDHSIPQSVIDEAFAYSKTFFALPTQTKLLAPHPPGGAHHRGYSGIGREKISQMVFEAADITQLRAVPDVKESYEMGREDQPGQPNIWLPPAHDIPGFRAFFLAFYEACYGLELLVLRALAAGMGLEPDHLVRSHRNRDCQTRLLHYPAVAESLLSSGRAERIAAHSDFGTLTLLWQDGVGGLEIESPPGSGAFVGVPAVDGAVLVNLGDFMQRWSNDVLRSTVHRVRAPPPPPKGAEAAERYSVVFFCSCDFDKVVDCLPGCWSAERPKRYEPVSAAEYIQMRMAALY